MLLDARGRELSVVGPTEPTGPRRIEVLTRLREAIRTRGGTDFRGWDVHGLLQTAMSYCDWPAVQQLAGQLHRKSPDDDYPRACLATACLREGSLAEARHHATMAMLCDPLSVDAQRTLWEIERWEELRSRFPAIPLSLRQRGPLRLELLAPHHLSDFFWHYDDPDIPRLCCLPSFRSAEQWLAWLDHEYRLNDRLTFATMHCDWGFVGVVSFVLHRGVGFVYYWVGRDFRGRGFASEGTSLLLDLAGIRWRMHTCYAKVFEENAASIRVLDKLGFRPAAIQPLPDGAREVLLRRGPPCSELKEAMELRQMLHDMRYDMRLPPTAVRTSVE